MISPSRGCCWPNPGGLPGIYGSPRFLAPSDGPKNVVVSSTTTSYTLVTIWVTAMVRLIVTSLEGISCVTVEVRVASTDVVSDFGRVVTAVVSKMLDNMVVVTWMGVV